MAVKSDLYTHINLYSNHESGLRASVWTASELTNVDELKKLRDAYWEAQNSSYQPASSTSKHPGVAPLFPGTGSRLDGGVAAPFVPPPFSSSSAALASTSSAESSAKPSTKSKSVPLLRQRVDLFLHFSLSSLSSLSPQTQTHLINQGENQTCRRSNLPRLLRLRFLFLLDEEEKPKRSTNWNRSHPCQIQTSSYRSQIQTHRRCTSPCYVSG
ncbi:hypothetical protein BDY24DRAFT_217729 [Mrakia frigida]|uniref:uncharacterized protein n=1 Tax=Mrakia frigida TaxID=29902 RepID=UPI003FCBEF08